MDGVSGPVVLWLLFGSWVVHDTEELLVSPGWLDRNERRLSSLAAQSQAADRFLAVVEGDRVALAVAIGIIGGFVLLATVLGYLDPIGLGMFAYATILGGFTLHVGVHLAQAWVLRGYVPGLLTGIVVVLPACGYLYTVLLDGEFISVTVAIASAVLGLAVVVPTAIVSHRVGRAVADRIRM